MGRLACRRLALAVAGLCVACGLRTDPLDIADTELPAETDSIRDAGVEGDAGTCSQPIELPQTNASAEGFLSGAGLYTGTCGADSGDEDVYRFVPAANTDVTIVFDPERTDISASVRVVENGCMMGDGPLELCDGSVIDDGVADPRHFFAWADREYFITVDSAAGSEGSYAFDLILGPPPLSQCGVHPERIQQVPGSTFEWFNEFGEGTGRVDGICGGSGKENMFQLDATYPGNMYVTATGSGNFDPIVSVRTGCDTTSEQACDQAQGTAALSFFIPGPGTYYVVVDDLSPDGGAFELSVSFD